MGPGLREWKTSWGEGGRLPPGEGENALAPGGGARRRRRSQGGQIPWVRSGLG